MKINKEHKKPSGPEELAEWFGKYFDLCIKNGIPPNVEGLAMVSGYARSSFFDINQGKIRSDLTDIVKNAKDYIAMFTSTLAQSGKIPAPVYIFRAKNFEGLRDVQEIKATSDYVPEVPEDEQDILKRLPDQN